MGCQEAMILHDRDLWRQEKNMGDNGSERLKPWDKHYPRPLVHWSLPWERMPLVATWPWFKTEQRRSARKQDKFGASCIVNHTHLVELNV